MHDCLNRSEKDNIVITNTSFLHVYVIKRLIIQCVLCLVRKPFNIASIEKSILFTINRSPVVKDARSVF